MDHEVFLWSVSQFRLVFFFQARQAGEERARQATADLRRELEEVKLARQADADRHAQEEERARQADADLRKEVVEIKRLRRGDADLIAELKKLIQSEIGTAKLSKNKADRSGTQLCMSIRRLFYWSLIMMLEY